MVYNTLFMNPAAAAMVADIAQLKKKIFERARGIAEHPDIEELKSRLAEQAEGIEGLR